LKRVAASPPEFPRPIARRQFSRLSIKGPNHRIWRDPGHVFPLRAKKGGVLVRPGQTEAAVDIARIAGLYPAGVICEIMNEDGTMARLPQLREFASIHGLKIISVADLVRYRITKEVLVRRAVELISRPSMESFARSLSRIL
jgi:3,4-dihydroxy-2-butanone 4-phosphate synthase